MVGAAVEGADWGAAAAAPATTSERRHAPPGVGSAVSAEAAAAPVRGGEPGQAAARGPDHDG